MKKKTYAQEREAQRCREDMVFILAYLVPMAAAAVAGLIWLFII